MSDANSRNQDSGAAAAPICYRLTPRGVEPTPPDALLRQLAPVTRHCLAQPLIEQGTRDWLFVRKFGLTASTAADAVHVGPVRYWNRDAPRLERFEMAEQAMDEKCGLRAPFEGNAATQHGNLHEPVALASFAAQHCTPVFHVGLLIHARHRWLGASPDGVTLDGRLVEIKVPKSRTVKVGNPVPPHYWVQCQIQMEVIGAEQCVYYEYRVPSTSKRARIKEPRINQVVVQRDREWFAAALPLMRAFVVHMYRLRALAELYETPWAARERREARDVQPARQRVSPLSKVNHTINF